jgi:integrase
MLASIPNSQTKVVVMPTKTASNRQPTPPYLHPSGQWAKKIQGVMHYYGKDKDAAFAAWQKQQSYVASDITPPPRGSCPTLAELGNVYADYLRRAVDAGEISGRTSTEYTKSIHRFIAIAGAGCRVDALRPIDFGTIKERLSLPVAVADDSKRYGGRKVKRRAITTVAIDIRNLRVFLNWCYKQEHMENPPKFGDEFSPVSRKALRRKRAVDGPKDLSASTIAEILTHCKPALRAMVLLGVNAGVGNQDIADITLADIGKLKKKGENWIDLPRGKTGAPRRFLLWPETAKAISDYLIFRPRPAGAENHDRLFLTRNGLSWVRQDGELRTDSIGNEFAKARKAAKIKRGSFYDLRRTFRTIAGKTRDREAVDFIMGHCEDPEDMGAVYTQWIDDDRLRDVCNYVRQWLLGAEVAK